MKLQKEYVFEGNLPRKNKFLLSLMMMRFPLFLPPVKSLIRHTLKNCKNIEFFPGFLFFYGQIHAEDVHFGDSVILDYAPVFIGEHSMLSWGCIIATGYHDFENHAVVRAKPVIIGKNVNIYARCVIIGGVTIGDNCVIAAGSVVTKNIPANSFAGGNPARVIRKLR